MSDCDCDPTEEVDGWVGFYRECGACGYKWGSNHCEHDGVQNPCPECGWRLPGSKTPMQFLGFAH